MKEDKIIEIGIDDKERLYIKPFSNNYSMIYREGVEVNWDSECQFLYSPKPREWSYFDWYCHIIDTAESDSNSLMISSETQWSNIPEELRSEIEQWMKNK